MEWTLLYDGMCGFCNRTVRFVLARDRGGAMRFAPLQGPVARALLAAHPELAAVDSLVVVVAGGGRPDRIAVRSEAVLAVAEYLGGVWTAAGLLRLVPRPARDWAYDRFARVRYRWFGRYDACPMPPPEARGRFL